MQNPILIVGAGAAGIGIGVLLKRLELPFLIIDQKDVGASFSNWSKETRFISPSFTGNAFGAVDLNAVTPDTSPAFSLRSEHPTGEGYAAYLRSLAQHFDLPVRTNVTVNSVKHDRNGARKFVLDTSAGDLGTNYLIWAAGEFNYPNRQSFTGAEDCLHYADIDSWANLKGDDFSIIGGYESGVDAAYQLAKLGKKVTLFDGDNQLNKHGSDSSYTLSPFTRDRFESVKNNVNVINANIDSIKMNTSGFMLHTTNQNVYESPTTPINCTGFTSSLSLVKDLFDFKDNAIQLTDQDESTRCENLFLVGPQVRHGEAIFCFIYKYRQRFGIVGETLSHRTNGNRDTRIDVINYYRNNQFYLDDLSCCEDECAC